MEPRRLLDDASLDVYVRIRGEKIEISDEHATALPLYGRCDDDSQHSRSKAEIIGGDARDRSNYPRA